MWTVPSCFPSGRLVCSCYAERTAGSTTMVGSSGCFAGDSRLRARALRSYYCVLRIRKSQLISNPIIDMSHKIW
jgi:hypothetical protein